VKDIGRSKEVAVKQKNHICKNAKTCVTARPSAAMALRRPPQLLWGNVGSLSEHHRLCLLTQELTAQLFWHRAKAHFPSTAVGLATPFAEFHKGEGDRSTPSPPPKR
jgi:hypothetical protein